MSVEENKAIARRIGEEAWDQGNVAVLDELLAADFVYHNPGPGLTPDREGYKQQVSMNRAAFSDFRFTTEDMIAEGDKVVIRWTWRGTHKGEFMGIPPTGKQVTVTGICIHRIEGGKNVEERHEIDLLGLMQQLGVVPSPGQ
jgi:steroid delta-isomerase-like uncharacterized protein